MRIGLIISRVLARVFDLLSGVWLRIQGGLWGISIPSSVKVYGRVSIRNRGELIIGEGTRFRSGYSNFVGAGTPMALETYDNGCIKIGRGCAISNTTIISRKSVSIGRDVFIGGGCHIYDNDFHHLDPGKRKDRMGGESQGIKIEDNVFVGAHSTILKGVHIGSCSVVGAGSVVTRSIPPNEVWAGVPAKKINVIHGEKSE